MSLGAASQFAITLGLHQVIFGSRIQLGGHGDESDEFWHEANPETHIDGKHW